MDGWQYTGAPDECDQHWPKKPSECGCKMHHKTTVKEFEYRNATVQRIDHPDLGPMFSVCTMVDNDGSIYVEILDHANDEICYQNNFAKE